ncbi:hypothetical protein BN946_scf184815.g10 [Trametes cinnabarina]|uniref:HAUS augmin-like complex subunit 6 N-terminal domain-containing protein n=1 Tax=Pycnoporus cinnabarinus TaxID=5643 RepID=A0A060S7L2_PYCCI|nr:hypothetical protein BN946_scf184815.g10 [Trametes cinnabarina]
MEHRIPNGLLILLHLHLLNYPVRPEDAAGYNEHLFSPSRGMRERSNAMEDICYFLVGKIERDRDRARSILPSYPCLQPSDTTAFRIALAKYMEAIRNSVTHTTHAVDRASDPSSSHKRPIPRRGGANASSAWWWKDVVVRKSILDECAGERFERLVLAFSSHAVLKNVTRMPDALVQAQSSSGVEQVTSNTLSKAYTALLAAAQSERLGWERSAASLLQRQAALATIRARLADQRHASSSKYDSLDTARLLALRDARLRDLLRGGWRGDEGQRALQLITSLAGLADTASPSAVRDAEASGDEGRAQTVSQLGEAQASAPAATSAASSLPIAAARHPSHLRGLSAPLFPEACAARASVTDNAEAARPPHAVEERLAAIEEMHRSLQEALAAAQGLHTKLSQRLQKAKGREAAKVPSRDPRTPSLKLDASLWARRAGNGVAVKSPELAATLLSRYDLELSYSESSVEEHIAHIRNTVLPSFVAEPSPEPEPEPDPIPNVLATRLPQASSRVRSAEAGRKHSAPTRGVDTSKITTATQITSRVRIAEDSVRTTRARETAGQSNEEKARAASRRLSRRASAARTRRSTMFGRGEDAEVLRDRSGSEGEDDVDVQGHHKAPPHPSSTHAQTPKRTQRHLGTRGTLLSTAKKTAPRQSYDIEVHERAAHVPRLPSLRLSDALELEEGQSQPQDRRVDKDDDESLYEGNSMTLADILLHAGHQGNASMQLLEEEMEEEMSDWD